MAIQFRFAESEEDKIAVYRLRYELYVEDQGLFLAEADHENRWLTDTYDAFSDIAMAEDNGRLIGSMRITMSYAHPFSQESLDE